MEELEKAKSFWAGFDLDGRRAELDARALDVANGKEASAEARKHLAKLTSSFRERFATRDSNDPKSFLEALVAETPSCKGAVDEIREREAKMWSGAAELVKAYQDELDGLSRRARASDAAFLSLYRSLYAAPDPTNALRTGLREAHRSADVMSENDRLTKELSAYDGEFAELKNQEQTIRRLEDALRAAEREADAKAERVAEQRVADVEKEAELRISAARERERGLERRLQQAEALRPKAQGVAVPHTRSEPNHQAMATEAAERAAAAETECAKLRAMLKKQHVDPTAPLLKRRLADMETECADLRAALADARRDANFLRDERADLADKLDALESNLSDEQRARQKAEKASRLADDDKRELEALRQGALDDDADPERTVDSDLIARLRRENASLRAKLTEQQQQPPPLSPLPRPREVGGLAALLEPSLQDQKDKALHDRISRLEHELSAVHGALRRERLENDRLQSERTALADKLRVTRQGGGGRGLPDIVIDGDSSSLDPFAQFEKAARSRKFSLPERIAVPLLRHPNVRQCLFAYVLVLHFLVFAATFYVSHNHHRRKGLDCSP